MRFAEGMAHAPLSHSSERPAEHDEVERSRRVRKALGPTDPEADAPREAPEPPAGRVDSRPIRVDPPYDRPATGEPQRQPPLAAADLENVPASPLGDALEGAHLSLLRVDPYHHRLLPPAPVADEASPRPAASVPAFSGRA